jgi:hypothetical protein
LDVFVSYASEDKAIADAAVATLEAAQVRCWYAPRDILPSKPYAEAILDGLRASRVLLVVVSAHSQASPQVARELERAIHYALVIVPFRVESVEMRGSFEYFLSLPHWLDALTPPLEAHLGRLRDAVRSILDTNLQPAPAPTSDRRPPPTPPKTVEEVSPDQWSRRSDGRLRRFFDRFLQDPE